MSTIVEQELEVRAIVYGVKDANSLLIKKISDGRVYDELCVGENLSLNTRDGKLYLDAAGEGGSPVGKTGIPIYANHGIVPTPPDGVCTEYMITGDYDFTYFKWPDGLDHNRRKSLDMIVDE
jgi:hypothetical protein